MMTFQSHTCKLFCGFNLKQSSKASTFEKLTRGTTLVKLITESHFLQKNTIDSVLNIDIYLAIL